MQITAIRLAPPRGDLRTHSAFHRVAVNAGGRAMSGQWRHGGLLCLPSSVGEAVRRAASFIPLAGIGPTPARPSFNTASLQGDVSKSEISANGCALASGISAGERPAPQTPRGIAVFSRTVKSHSARQTGFGRLLWVAVCALLFASLELYSSSANAQPITLVDNLDQSTVDPLSLNSNNYTAIAQSFETGASPYGYLIDSVELDISASGLDINRNNPLGFTLHVSLTEGVSGDSTSSPAEPSVVPGLDDVNILHQWTYTRGIAETASSFMVRREYTIRDSDYSSPKGGGNVTLMPNRTYFVVFRYDNIEHTDANGDGMVQDDERGHATGLDWNFVTTANTDDSSQPDWSIPTEYMRLHVSDGKWRTVADVYSQMEVKGTVEGPLISISPPDAAVEEGDSGTGVELVYTVSISETPRQRITVDYEPVAYAVTGPTTAKPGEDYVASDASGTVAWEAGDATDKEIRVRVVGDELLELNPDNLTQHWQDLALALTNPAGGGVLDSDMSMATGRINDDEERLQITVNTAAAVEGDAGDAERHVVFTIVKMGDHDDSVIVRPEYYVHSSRLVGAPSELTVATKDMDFTTVGIAGISASLEGFINLAPGELRKSISFPVVSDNIAEVDKYMGMAFLSASNFEFIGGSGVDEIHYYATLTDDDRGISIDSPEIAEADGSNTSALTYAVSLDGEWPQPVIVEYAVEESHADATATAGTDYTDPPDGTLTFPASSSASMTFPVTVAGDDAFEGDETVIATISNARCDPSCGTDLAPTIVTSEGTGTILDNDAPRITIGDAPAVDEGDPGDANAAVLVYTVSIDAAPAQTVTVDYAPTTYDGAAAAADGITTAMGTGGQADYEAATASGMLTFTPTSGLTQDIRVTVVGDELYELGPLGEDQLAIELSIVTGEAILGGAIGTGVIRNDDDKPVLRINAPTVAEGETGANTNFEFSFRRDRLVDERVDFTVSMDVHLSTEANNPSTAVLGTDYTSSDISAGDSAHEIAFSANELEKTVSFSVVGDNAAETDETLIVNVHKDTVYDIWNSSASAIFQQSEDALFTGTITDDDRGISINSPSVTEADSGDSSMLEFTVALDGAWPEDVTVDYEVDESHAQATATAGTDYADPTDGTLTFPMNSSASQMFSVTVAGDDEGETDETVIATISNAQCSSCPSGLAPNITTDMGTGTIVDNDALRVSIDSPTVTEGASGMDAMTFTVSVSAAPEETETVSYSIGGTATAGASEDYTADSARMLTFQQGSSASQTITVTVNDDDIYEADETVVVTLSAPSSGIVLGRAVGTGTIVNDDSAPVFSFTATSVSVTEGDSGSTDMSFSVEKTGETEVEATVSYELGGTAEGGVDYALPAEMLLTFAPVDTVKTVIISVTGDILGEPDETVTVTLAAPEGATVSTAAGENTATGTIVDDDPLTLSIDSPEIEEGDSGTTTLSFTVSLASQPSAPVTVAYAVADGTATSLGSDADYEVDPPNGVITFPANSAAPQTIDVTINGDMDDESHETIVVTLSNPTGGAVFEGGGTELTSTGTILSDDLPVLSISSPSVVEGDSGTTDLVFVVSLSEIEDQSVTVDYAVEDGSAESSGSETDYTVSAATGTLTFAASTTDLQQNVTVSVIGDSIVEPDETVTVTLSNPTNAVIDTAAGVGIGTIVTDDRGLSISGPGSSVQEGEAGAELVFTVTLEPAAAADFEVGYEITDRSTATEVADYGTPVPASPLVFAMGDSTKTITIAVNDDFVEETDETVEIMLVPAGGSDSITGAIVETASAEGVILPRMSQGGSVLSVRPGPVEEGDSGSEPTVGLAFVMDPPRTYATTVEYRVRLQSGESVGVSTPVSLPANQDEAKIDHPLGQSFDIDNADSLEVVVEKVSRTPGGASDPDVSIRGVQVAAAGGGAATPVRGRQNARLGKSMGYVLAGTGRSLATSLVDSLWERAKAHRSGGGESIAVVGGRAIDTEAFASGETENGAIREIAGLLGFTPVAPSELSFDSGHRVGGGNFNAYRQWARLPASADLAGRSRFALSSGDGVAGSIAFWGRGNTRSFESELEEDGFSSESDTSAWLLGLDYRLDESTVLGVAVTSQSGESSYAYESNMGEGTVDTSLTSVSPWLYWTSSSGFEIWGAVGFGSGTAELEEGNESVEADVGAQILAAGVRGWESTFIGLRTAVKADAFMASLSSDKTEGAIALPESDGSSTRVRLAIEAAGGGGVDNDGPLSIGADVGARFDSGEAESGTGADAALDFRFASQGGFEVTGRSGFLLFHGQEGFGESSLSLGLAYDPGTSGRGLHLSFEPSWNAPALSGSSLWDSAPNADALESSEAEAVYRARLGYGLPALGGRALETAFGEVESGGEDVHLRAGLVLRQAEAGFGRFQLGVYGVRDLSDPRSVNDSVKLEGRLGF